MKPLFTIAVALMLAVPMAQAAQSCSSDQIEALEEDKQFFGPLSWPVCKALPNKPELTLASYYVWTDGGPVGERVYQWNTLIMDSSSHEVLAKYRQQIEEDSYTKVRPDSIWLDTANYALNQQIRAFGVRLDIGRKPTCSKEYKGQYFSLFVYREHILSPVLERLPMEYSRVHDGKDCGNNQRWDKEVAKSQLQMLSSKHYGFADIKVKSKGKMTYKPKNRQRDKSRTHVQTLWFDGERYRFVESELPGYLWKDGDF